MSIKEYFVSLFTGFGSLLKGMAVTGRELFTPKVTEKYPENRAELKIPERFRATLQFVYDEQGNHKCIVCGSCERACPNGTISITSRTVTLAETLPNGKPKTKKKLDKYIYDLGSCTFCDLCVLSCPTGAIEFSNDFEQAVFTRAKLVKQLNNRPEPEEAAPAPKPTAPAPKSDTGDKLAAESKSESEPKQPHATQGETQPDA